MEGWGGGDDATPCDVEPNGGPCRIVVTNEQIERAVVVLDEYRSPNNNDGKLAKLRKQLAALEAIEREHDRKIKVMNDIVDCRERIKALGEIPCA
jgi:hypothetical protein